MLALYTAATPPHSPCASGKSGVLSSLGGPYVSFGCDCPPCFSFLITPWISFGELLFFHSISSQNVVNSRPLPPPPWKQVRSLKTLPVALSSHCLGTNQEAGHEPDLSQPLTSDMLTLTEMYPGEKIYWNVFILMTPMKSSINSCCIDACTFPTSYPESCFVSI